MSERKKPIWPWIVAVIVAVVGVFGVLIWAGRIDVFIIHAHS